MNILTDTPPESVLIGETEYPIRADFRTALRMIMAFESSDLTSQEKQIVTLENFYPTLPDDIAGAVERLGWFLNGGEEKEEVDSSRVYSFEHDANYIFSAFRQTHGIDLATAQLHWWTFLALFMDLGQDTFFCQLVGLRKRYKAGKVSKEERQMIRDMGDIFFLPNFEEYTPAEREAIARFEALLAKNQEQEFLDKVNNGSV